MKLFSALAEKPWLPQQDNVATDSNSSLSPELSHELSPELSPERTALRFFLSVVSVIFFLFIITFLERSQYSDFNALSGEPWLPFTQPTGLWLNSIILLLSSVALQVSVYSSRKSQMNVTLVGITLGALFAMLFILGQLWVWQQLLDQGYFMSSNPANSYFYLLTTIHGLHLVGGLFALAKVTLRFWQGVSLEKMSESIELCATYWHYLFVLWMLLFGLLASDPDTYQAIAAMCGFLR